MNGTVMGPVVTPPLSKATAQEVGVGERGEYKHDGIEGYQQPLEVYTQQDTYHAHHKEEANAHRDSQHKHIGVDVRYVVGQYLQIGSAIVMAMPRIKLSMTMSGTFLDFVMREPR